MVTVDLLLFLGGLVVLLWGGDKLVDSATVIAKRHGLSQFFIGVTVISIGTSVPEIAVTVVSAVQGAGDLVVGNIIGSETAQITLAIGVVSLIAPITGKTRDIVMYGGSMLAAMVIMIFALNAGVDGTFLFNEGMITRAEGILMVLVYVFFVAVMYTTQGGEEVVEGVDVQQQSYVWTFLVLGLIAVPAGAQMLVDGGVALATVLGVPQYLIGLLTGLGTTIPEIAVAGLAAWRQTAGISAGSLLGSNITDPLFSLGIAGLVADVQVTDLMRVTNSGLYMVAVSTVIVGYFAVRGKIDRWFAVVCILLYIPALLLL